MRLEWIAATLNPSDVAPHPNFMGSDKLSPASMFALLVQARFSDFERLAGTADGSAGLASSEVASSGTVENLVVAAARASLDADTSLAGAARLAELSNERTLDPACRVAAVLLATVALSELDRHTRAIALLEATLQALPPAVTSDADLLHAVVLQQLALRKLESGRSGSADSERSLELLRRIRVSELSSFPVSRSVRWRSKGSLRLIIEELRGVVEAHLFHERQDVGSRDWVRLVRTPAPRVGLQLRRDAEGGLARYVQQMFEEKVRSTGETIFSGDPIEQPIYAVLLHYELIGAILHVRSRRSILARMRVLRNEMGDPVWIRRDAIRLFRQADDIKGLKAVLQHTRAGGPLLALRMDALQVLEQRLDTTRLRRVELSVLSAAAHLLSVEEASRALDAVHSCISEGVPARSARWEALSVRLEDAWGAAVELAATSENLDFVARSLLGAAEAVPADDELLIGGLTRSAMRIEWEGVSSTTRDAWAKWLVERSSPAASAMVEVVGPEVGVEPDIGTSDDAPLERGAAILNRFFRTGVLPEAAELAGLKGAVVGQLRRISADAARGSYSFGSVSAGDVAVGLALHTDAPELWEAIIDFLLDVRVNASDKAAPLERLAYAKEPLPPDVLRALSAGLDELLRSRSIGMFGASIVPFPSALRAAVAHSLISDEKLLNELMQLAASVKAAARVEAARTLTVVALRRAGADWVAVLALQLSHDSDAVVRGEAGRSLGALVQATDRHRALLDQRVLELLAEDGLVVPLLVLRGLQTDGEGPALPSALIRRIRELAIGHVARGVRLQAQALL